VPVRVRPSLTYANVMATIAVFIALGGASYAALKLPKNSIGSKQLKKNAVTTAKIKNEAVTAAKVKKGALTGAQIDALTLGTVPNAAHATSADNADRLGGLNSDGYLQEVAAGSLVWDPPSLAPGECDGRIVKQQGVQSTDVVLATPLVLSSFPGGFQVTALTALPNTIFLNDCNSGSSTQNPEQFQLNWRLLR
jgi:hypothetical protein